MDEALQISGDDPRPLHVQLSTLLRAEAQRLGIGSAFLSEQEIASQSGVSRATVRTAIATLIKEGILYTKPGSGTFVAKPRLETDLSVPAGFTDTALQLGRTPTTQVVNVTRIAAEAEIAAQLEINPDQSVWQVERLRLLDGQPAMFEQAHLPVQLFPKLDSHDLTQSLYHIMRDVYRLEPNHGIESVFAVNADHHLAVLLQIPIAAALLASVRVSKSAAGQPLEFTRRFVRPDQCAYSVHLGQQSQLSVRPSVDPLTSLENRISVLTART